MRIAWLIQEITEAIENGWKERERLEREGWGPPQPSCPFCGESATTATDIDHEDDCLYLHLKYEGQHHSEISDPSYWLDVALWHLLHKHGKLTLPDSVFVMHRTDRYVGFAHDQINLTTTLWAGGGDEDPDEPVGIA